MGQIETRPTDNLVRGVFPGVELRAEGTSTAPAMVGHFAVFNQWTEIDSYWEGQFLERFVPGAFKKTMVENRDRMRVLFQHGMDPQIGDKPLGAIDLLREDETGANYEVSLLDASYVREDVLPGLRAGVYGASFRFASMREEWVEDPGVSEHNPKGLPERTIKEARVAEFGPVTFPAYDGASAGVRSLTDEFVLERSSRNPERLKAIIDFLKRSESVAEPAEASQDDNLEIDSGPPVSAETVSHPDGGEEENAPPKVSAETVSHPDSGRREQAKELFGTGRTNRPSWHL